MSATALLGGVPCLGLGVYLTTPGKETENAVLEALRLGYRHIDTAKYYENEADVGRAVRESGLKREEVFVTTKIWCMPEPANGDGFNDAINQVKDSLKKSGLDYFDLVLTHSPHHKETRADRWRGLEDCVAKGLVKHIGVSNYGTQALEDCLKHAKIPPLVNQIEVHVFCQRTELVDFCQSKGVAVQAYSPLAKAGVLTDATLLALGKKHNKSAAQIMLRWCLQRNLIILPKSVTPSRIKENMEVFDFVLDEADMEALRKLDRNMTTGWDPTTLL